MFKRSLTSEEIDAVSIEQKSINSTGHDELRGLDKFIALYSAPTHWALSVGIVFVLIYLILEQAAQADLLAKNDIALTSEIHAVKTQLLHSPAHTGLQNEALPEKHLSILYLGHIQLSQLSKALVELDGEQILVMPGQALKLDWQIKELNQQYLLLESKSGQVMKVFREGL